VPETYTKEDRRDSSYRINYTGILPRNALLTAAVGQTRQHSSEKVFKLSKGVAVSVGLNVYNLLNSQLPVSYIQEDTELFGRVC